eukprot:7143020-Prymnesium_polylepis.1
MVSRHGGLRAARGGRRGVRGDGRVRDRRRGRGRGRLGERAAEGTGEAPKCQQLLQQQQQ